nr:hypothetical protein [Rhodococcus sp. 15-1154-1]
MMQILGYAWTAATFGAFGFFLWPRPVVVPIVDRGTYTDVREVEL